MHYIQPLLVLAKNGCQQLAVTADYFFIINNDRICIVKMGQPIGTLKYVNIKTYRE